VYTIAQIDGIMGSRHGFDKLRGKHLRIRTKIESVADTSVSVMYSPVNFFYENFVFEGFGDADLDPLKPGDTVEIMCQYYDGGRTDRPGDQFGSMKYLFLGREIHKVQ
jgi:hypothetical protein